MDTLVFRQEEKPRLSPPAHYNALSKIPIAPENSGSRHFDFRISIYLPGACDLEFVVAASPPDDMPRPEAP